MSNIGIARQMVNEAPDWYAWAGDSAAAAEIGRLHEDGYIDILSEFQAAVAAGIAALLDQGVSEADAAADVDVDAIAAEVLTEWEAQA